MRSWFTVVLAAGIVVAGLPCGVGAARAASPSAESWTAFRNPLVVSDVNAGATATGFAMVPTVRDSLLTVGLPIYLDISTTNVTDETLQCMFECSAEFGYDLQIQGPSGPIRTISPPIFAAYALPSLITVAPGEIRVQTYTVPKEYVSMPGTYQFIVKRSFYRIDGGGVAIVPSEPASALIGGEPADARAAGGAGDTVVHRTPKPHQIPSNTILVKPYPRHISPPLVDARDVLEKSGFSVSTATDGKIVITRGHVTVAKLQPGSDTVQFMGNDFHLGRKVETRDNQLLVPGQIISLVRLFGGG